MASCTHRLQRRASLLALAIATAGASVHLAVLAFTDDETATARVVCATEHPVGARSGTLAGDPDYLDAVATRCRLAAAERCDVANVMSRLEAIVRAESILGAGLADHAFVRFAPEYGRIVWSVRDLDVGARAEIDAFDGRALEYAIDVK